MKDLRTYNLAKTLRIRRLPALPASRSPNPVHPWLSFLIPSIIPTAIALLALLRSFDVIPTRENHDLVARVLNVGFHPTGFPTTPKNSSGLWVDLALVNKGTQTEIIRSAFLCYSDTKDFTITSSPIAGPPTNMQILRGEKLVLRLPAERAFLFTGKKAWLGVSVTVIGAQAEDIQTTWQIRETSIPADGNGAWVSGGEDKVMRILSNKLEKHQHTVPDFLLQ